MAREKEDYRANMELLNVRFPDYDMLSVQDTMKVTGFKKRDTVLKHLGQCFVNGRISKAALARYMCG